MPTVKHDWNKLKGEYLAGNWYTVQSFLDEKGVFMNRVETKGWTKEKDELQKQALVGASKKIVEDDIQDITSIRVRQARMARYLQLLGAEKLQAVKKEATDNNKSVDMSIEDARKLVVAGLEQERKATGMEGGNPQSLTQININAGPKTNIDKLIENLDYEGTLELIAELKRLRAGRSLPTASANGAEQAKAE